MAGSLAAILYHKGIGWQCRKMGGSWISDNCVVPDFSDMRKNKLLSCILLLLEVFCHMLPSLNGHRRYSPDLHCTESSLKHPLRPYCASVVFPGLCEAAARAPSTRKETETRERRRLAMAEWKLPATEVSLLLQPR